ncbi:methyltransferase domain-containing protein [candidate division KSB1 bacterium]|nr:methyltransferase domain-containing protein [candidate division KSB1 bacterium]
MKEEHWQQSLVKHQSEYESLWRKHMQWLYLAYFREYTKGKKFQILLKSDLYDEAISEEGLLPAFIKNSEYAVAMDLSWPVAREGIENIQKQRPDWSMAVVTDALAPGFREQSIDMVFSNSTLDHFSSKRELHQALQQLALCLKSGGMLIITLDNPVNPLIFLRNLLPFKIVRKLGFIPYFMGKTLNRKQLVRLLERHDFKIRNHTTLLHAPRILFIWLARLICRFNMGHTWFLKLLRHFEKLEKLPTRDYTGYYVVVKAVKH